MFPKYPYSEAAAKDYLTNDSPDYSFSIDIDSIMKRPRPGGEVFSPAHTEWLEIYRDICAYIEKRDGILMHGAVIEYEGRGYMFTAPSGTGKTTHINQWRRLFGGSVTVVNGDKPIIRLEDGQFFVYGTPWSGKENLNTNTRTPLCGIAVLSRAAENSIEKIDDVSKYLPMLLRQVYIHRDPECASNVMDFLDKMLSRVPLYSLKCNISTDAARIAYEKMR